MNFCNLFDHFEKKLKNPYQTSSNKIYKKLFLFAKSCHTMHCYMVTFTGTFTKYFWSSFCLCVFSSKCLRPYSNLANFCNLCDHFQPKLKFPFRPQSIKFTKNCFYLVNLSLQWLHLQALFGLVSAFVFSVQNILDPTVIWLINLFFRSMSTI